MKRGHITSRSKSIAALIRKLVALRKPDMGYINGYFPNYKQKLSYYEQGSRSPKLDGFLDLMTALRCEVIVVPLGRDSEGGWYRLNDFPDNDGMVLKIPERIPKAK